MDLNKQIQNLTCNYLHIYFSQQFLIKNKYNKKNNTLIMIVVMIISLALNININI